MTTRQPPRFYGVDTYKDHLGRFSFRFPTTWLRYDLDDDRDGVMYRPRDADEHTSFSAWVSRLEQPSVVEDLSLLQRSIDEGLGRLPACHIDVSDDVVLENLLKFERVYTFEDGAAIRKRKTWIIYVDTWLLVPAWQGSSPDDFDYWLAMANYSFATFTLPDALWFALDRDLSRKA